MALNLSLVSPYMDKDADFASGVNFAVAGATALDRAVLLQGGVMMPPASVPLSTQLDWFKSHLNATCASEEGKLWICKILEISFVKILAQLKCIC